jgi:hypothetical protein
VLGLMIGLPTRTPKGSELVILQLENENLRLLKAGEPSETMKGEICDRVKLALLDAADRDLELAFLCRPASR